MHAITRDGNRCELMALLSISTRPGLAHTQFVKACFRGGRTCRHNSKHFQQLFLLQWQIWCFCVCMKHIAFCSSHFLSALTGILGNSEQKIVLPTIEQLLQYTVLEIQSLKCMIVTRICKYIQQLSITIQATQGDYSV